MLLFRFNLTLNKRVRVAFNEHQLKKSNVCTSFLTKGVKFDLLLDPDILIFLYTRINVREPERFIIYLCSLQDDVPGVITTGDVCFR